jgi:2-methylcitrate dehydratase PrpD
MSDEQWKMVDEKSLFGEELAEFVLNTKYAKIPKDVVEFTKVLVLKNIANMAAGARMPHSQKLVNLVRERRLPGEVGVLTYGFKTSLWEGVFLNAFFAHAAELEDDAFFDADYNICGPSWTITVIPLLLTLTQRQRLSGKQLIESVVVGLEVHRRSCLSTGWHRGVLLGPGSVGPAAGAAKALGLNKKEIMSAIGLAISGADIQQVNYGFDGHFFESAMQSLQALIAAQMAKNGLTGNPDLPMFLKLKYGDTAVEPEKMLADLGSRWLCKDFWIKKYPASFGLHNIIDLMCELKNKHKFSWDEIDVIEAFPIAPFLGIVPHNVAQAEVSLYWVLGVAAVDGDVTLAHMTEEALNNPIYQQAVAKVKQTVPPELSKEDLIPFSHMDGLKIHMKDGKVYSGERRYPIGSPKEPLTNEQVKNLFQKFVSGIYSSKEIDTITQAILNLEKLNDLGEVMDLLTYRGERGSMS